MGFKPLQAHNKPGLKLKKAQAHQGLTQHWMSVLLFCAGNLHSEEGEQAQFTVQLNRAASCPVSVTFNTADGTATCESFKTENVPEELLSPIR